MSQIQIQNRFDLTNNLDLAELYSLLNARYESHLNFSEMWSQTLSHSEYMEALKEQAPRKAKTSKKLTYIKCLLNNSLVGLDTNQERCNYYNKIANA